MTRVTSLTKFNCVLILAVLITLKSAAQTDIEYAKEIGEWHQTRINSLKAENGWLNLAGLFWLNEGRNTFGSSSDNNVVFPFENFPLHAGYFERIGNSVRLVAEKGVAFKSNQLSLNDELIFDSKNNALVISYNFLRWVIIKRDTKIGIRLRNLEHPSLKSFKGIDRFTVDATWKIKATLVPNSYQQFISITNVLGQTNQLPSPGKLIFNIGSTQYSLDALEEGDELFVIFGDETNGKETYPSGRFLYARKPGPDGICFLDFNKSINPPCAFTPYATCPLPPKQNILPVAIMAGEKNFHIDSH